MSSELTIFLKFQIRYFSKDKKRKWFCWQHFFPIQRNLLPAGFIRSDICYELLHLRLKYQEDMAKDKSF